jgi:hypothetical protein
MRDLDAIRTNALKRIYWTMVLIDTLVSACRWAWQIDTKAQLTHYVERRILRS